MTPATEIFRLRGGGWTSEVKESCCFIADSKGNCESEPVTDS